MTDATLAPTSLTTPKRGMAERLGNELRFVPVALGLVALILFFATQSDVFLTSRNLNNLLVQSTVTGIIALGLVFVLLTGEIDLSVAATSGIAAVFMAKMVVDFGVSVPLAIAARVALGGVGGGALLLESIAAAVIGGVSLFGGRGMVVGALFGALIIATVSNGLNIMSVANEARLIVTGLLLVIAVSIDRGIEKLAVPGG